MNKYIIGTIAALILFTAGLLTGKYYFAKTDIKIVKEIVTKTEYKYKDLKIENKPVFDVDNFNRLLYCYNSELKINKTVNDNWLNIHVADECKSIDLKYEIGTRGNYKIYFTIGIVGVGSGILLYHFLK